MYYKVYCFSLAPVPGGCNMEFEVETAPYLKVRHSDAMIEVNAQPSLGPGSSCTRDVVIHDFYRMYMPEKDFSEQIYFSAIQSMLTPLDVIEIAHLVDITLIS